MQINQLCVICQWIVDSTGKPNHDIYRDQFIHPPQRERSHPQAIGDEMQQTRALPSNPPCVLQTHEKRFWIVFTGMVAISLTDSMVTWFLLRSVCRQHNECPQPLVLFPFANKIGGCRWLHENERELLCRFRTVLQKDEEEHNTTKTPPVSFSIGWCRK